jgi:GAF domain-containing protein
MMKAELLQEFDALLVGRWITDLANASSFLFHEMSDVNWVGFYLFDGVQTLTLGPFQGRVACTEIALSRGVCGAAAFRRKTMVVQDVHEFPGHIACDPRSRAEVVVPLIKDGVLLGVLDIDSETKGRWTSDDVQFFEEIVNRLLKANK